jgi:hypothetical protein
MNDGEVEKVLSSLFYMNGIMGEKLYSQFCENSTQNELTKDVRTRKA